MVIDVTNDFLETTRRWLTHASELEGGLRNSLGNEVFDEQQASRKVMIAAVEEGLLCRALFVGTKPN